jgi:hypothetical protein
MIDKRELVTANQLRRQVQMRVSVQHVCTLPRESAAGSEANRNQAARGIAGAK